MNRHCPHTNLPCEFENCFLDCSADDASIDSRQHATPAPGRGAHYLPAGQPSIPVSEPKPVNTGKKSRKQIRKDNQVTADAWRISKPEQLLDIQHIDLVASEKYEKHKENVARRISLAMGDGDYAKYLPAARALVQFEYQAFIRGVMSRDIIPHFTHKFGKKVYFLPLSKPLDIALKKFGYAPEYSKELGYAEY